MLALSVAGSSSAAIVTVLTTLGTKLGFGKVGTGTATGVMTVNGSLGGDHLTTLRLAPTDPMDAAPVPVTDPETTGTVASNIVDGGNTPGGTFAPISGGGPLTQNILALAGVARVCLVSAGCLGALPLTLTKNAGATGVGVGGVVTVGGKGLFRVSLAASPWFLGSATRLVSTANGVVITRMFGGFIHAAQSGTSSTAKPSGFLQVITPTQVLIKGLAGNTQKIALFSSLTFHFIPEPGILLLLGSGVAGLALLGRSRMRK
jgi:hypothetical protein